MHKEVNLEIAQLLLEKKIDTSVSPTIFEVVIKLYEKHKIWISVTKEVEGFNFNIDNKYGLGKYQKRFNSPTEAYLKAIEYTLKTLI